MYIQVYGFYPAHGTAILSSMSCPSLQCTTFLRIPLTRIILSMASFTGIQRQAVNSESSIIGLLNLCEESGRIFAILKDRERVFSGAIDKLVKLMHEREPVVAPPTTRASEPVAQLLAAAEVPRLEEFSDGEEIAEVDGV